jgi:sugar lactone lactonase YvrE
MAAVGVIVVVIDCGDTNTMPAKSNGITQITVTPAATDVDTPLDATPDPMGTVIYFIANSPSGKAVYSVPAAGGTPMLIYAGAPLVDPHGISISSSGQTLFIADRAAGSNGGGAIFSMPTAGDTPVVVSGSEGTHPSALDLSEIGNSDDIYFTGTSNGDPAVYKLAAEGGTAEVLAKGAPLAMPDGVAVASNQTVYIADKQAGMTLAGQVFKLSGGSLAKLGPELAPGDPTGIAITLDDTKVLVSSLDPKAGTSQVTIELPETNMSSTFNDVIKANKVSGGLHRARLRETYAWAGYKQVYTVKLKTINADSSTPGGVGNNN